MRSSGSWCWAQPLSIPAALNLAAMGFLNALFYHLLKAPTLTGRKIMDQIEGFKLYLSVAEKERLNLLNPPEKTPALFEKYLPFALALDVENAWSEQFAEVLARAGTETQPYSPVWYSGSSWDSFHTSRFTNSLGSSFAGAISSSSSAPGLVLGERRRRVLRRRGWRRRRQRLVNRGLEQVGADRSVHPGNHCLFTAPPGLSEIAA